MSRTVRRSPAVVGFGAALTLVLGLAACTSSNTDDPGGSTTPSRDPTPSSSATSPVPSTTGGDPAAGDTGVPAKLRAAVSEPVEDPYYPDTSNPEVDVLRYQLELDYRPPVLHGAVTVTFRATEDTDTIRLDLSDALDVDRVRLDGSDASYEHHDDGLVTQTPGLKANTTHKLEIRYAGNPQPTPAPSARSDMTGGLGWETDASGAVHTFQEPYGAYTWYPSNDHPSDAAFFDATVTTPRADVAVFNGTLESTRHTARRTTTRWHLDTPATTYLTTLAIGPYREYQVQTSAGMPLSLWLMDRDKNLLPQLRRESATAFEWLVDRAGEYPFSSLGMVVVGGSSAMETQTMITLSRTVVSRPDAVLEHEIAHQWFGDSVRPEDWQALWLNEGWAMYMQQWYESDLDRYEYAGGIARWRAYDQESRARSGPPGDYDPQTFGDLNVYLGPALMLDRIRRRIGDVAFKRLVVAYAAEHAGTNIDRDEFTRWVNDYTGEDFTALIRRWLDSSTTPR